MTRREFMQSASAAAGVLAAERLSEAAGLYAQGTPSKGVRIRQIRNATLVVDYGGKRWLIDPMLSKKGTYAPFPSVQRPDQRNPLVDLPTPAEQLVQGIEAVFFSHLHIDHYDDGAKEFLPKGVKVFVQNDADKGTVQTAGFTNVEVLTDATAFDGIRLTRTRAQHGRMGGRGGQVSGLVLQHPTEKTVYIAGDTVWFDGVQEALDLHKPEIVVVNGGDNQFPNGGSLVMGKEDIFEVYKAAPRAQIIVSHMEAVNHYTLSRADLKASIRDRGMASNLLVPDDGESYTL